MTQLNNKRSTRHQVLKKNFEIFKIRISGGSDEVHEWCPQSN